MRKDQGTFIQVDGIDGAGKSTLLSAACAWAEQRHMRIFDVVAWSKQEKRLPTLQEVGDADLLLTAEPSHAWIGAAIRDEIIRNGTPYHARFAAQAFALDRGVQYRRLVLPFLQSRPNRWVLQDRGLLSSLAYQPLQSQQEVATDPSQQAVTIEWLLELDGNRIALDDPPDIFVFLDVDARLAQERLAGRTAKIDDHRFDAFEFQHALASRYRDPTVSAPLTSRGTQLAIINGAQDKAEVAQAMVRLLENRAK